MKSIKEVLRGNLLILIIGDIFRSLSLFITFPYFSLYIQALGGNIIHIGLMNSLYPFIAFFLYPLGGYLADRYSRVRIVVITGYFSALIQLIYMLAPNWQMLAIGNLLSGVDALFFPAMSALMADSVLPQQRGVGYSFRRLVSSAIGILSPYIGGYFITILGVAHAMRVLHGLTSISSALIATINLKFLKENVKRDGKGASNNIFRLISRSYFNMFEVIKSLSQKLKMLALVLSISVFFQSLTTPYWVIYFIFEIGLSELQWGIVLLLMAVVNVLLLIPVGIIIDRFDVKKILLYSLALSTIPIFLFPFRNGFIELIFLFVAISIFNTFLFSAGPVLMVNLIPSSMRGRIMALLGQGWLFINTRNISGGNPGMGVILTLPSILGSILSGFIYNYNPSLPWLLLGTAMVINTILFSLISPSRNTNFQDVN
jgi:MFS family permease